MSRHQASIVLVALVFIAACTYGIFLTSLAARNGNTQDLTKIECFLHRDNADVHKLCVDHGYDR